MSDETYYTVLNVPETASLSEIKTAYRDLIRQVHPDTISDLAPYLRRIAEEKAKEITEAYSVLSSSSKRREYDAQLAVYRRQTTAQAPPPPPAQQATSQTSSSRPYCDRCGTSIYATGFCPKCNKSSASAASPQQPRTLRWIEYHWVLLKRWLDSHPTLAPVFYLGLIALLGYLRSISSHPLSGNDTSR
jgi:curved DNA-binding protein CbpA